MLQVFPAYILFIVHFIKLIYFFTSFIKVMNDYKEIMRKIVIGAVWKKMTISREIFVV